jgi:hypothetical protein
MIITKKLFLLAIAALTLSLLSCSKDNGEEGEGEEGMAFLGRCGPMPHKSTRLRQCGGPP